MVHEQNNNSIWKEMWSKWYMSRITIVCTKRCGANDDTVGCRYFSLGAARREGVNPKRTNDLYISCQYKTQVTGYKYCR